MPSVPQYILPRLNLFGGFQLLDPLGQDVHLPTRKAALLLALVAMEPNARIGREKACQILWPDNDEPQAKNSLRQVLSNLRKALNIGDHRIIDADTRHLWIDAPEQHVDILQFRQLAKSDDIHNLALAADTYQGEFLDGFRGLPDMGSWLRDQRSDLQREASHLAEKLSNHVAQASETLTVPCLNLARRLLASDPTDEAAHRAIIRVLLASGNTTDARKQYESCKVAMFGAFQAEPEPATTQLLERNVRSGSDDGPPTRPAQRSAHPNTGTDRRPSLVVLPFDDLSQDQKDYFAEGVVEEITSALSRVGDFFVIARQSALSYKNRIVPLEDIGNQLGVAYAVEGILKRSGTMLRLHVHLVDTASSRQIWSDRFDGTVDDVFLLQDTIAQKVAVAISPSIRTEEISRARSKPVESRETYELVLAGFPNLWTQTRDGNLKARKLFERAWEISPRYGRAGALLAWCHAQDVTYFWSDNLAASQENCSRCLAQAMPHIQDDATALVAAGAAAGHGEGDLEKGQRLLEQALALDANNSWAWARLAWNNFFAGRYYEARKGFENAKKLSPLDPLSFNIENGLAGVLFVDGRFEEAAAVSLRNFENDTSRIWSLRQYAAYAALAGDIQKANAALIKYLADHPNATIASNRRYHPQRNNAHYMSLYTDGLRLAGMAEE